MSGKSYNSYSYSKSLNPYYNGKYSMRLTSERGSTMISFVLILIIMENTL